MSKLEEFEKKKKIADIRRKAVIERYGDAEAVKRREEELIDKHNEIVTEIYNEGNDMNKVSLSEQLDIVHSELDEIEDALRGENLDKLERDAARIADLASELQGIAAMFGPPVEMPMSEEEKEAILMGRFSPFSQLFPFSPQNNVLDELADSINTIFLLKKQKDQRTPQEEAIVKRTLDRILEQANFIESFSRQPKSSRKSGVGPKRKAKNSRKNRPKRQAKIRSKKRAKRAR